MVFFIEYYLHKQLVAKMKLLGMNGLFCFKSKLNISKNFIAGIATATAVCLQALPIPKALKIYSKKPNLTQPFNLSSI